MRAFIAFALVLVVSPFVGSMAFAEGTSGPQDGSADGGTDSAAVSSEAVADPSTIWDWEKLVSTDTASVGRIWTDKTVATEDMTKEGITIQKGDADFLTALTALSSTSNLTTTTSTPLDVVLVLDTSSSMTQSMGSTTKLKALQAAADKFVDTLATQNSVASTSELHKIAVVSYNMTATVNVDMTDCTTEAATAKTGIKYQIDNLKTSQGTCSDEGLKAAAEVLNKNKREDAKQVVVFFTDGTPTKSGQFDSGIASEAVKAAGGMKDGGATVYTIGVLDGADPSLDPTGSDVSSANKFLHAVSSNYPEATYAKSSGSSSYTWDFGDRAKDSNFYKSATDADGLADIFADISKEIMDQTGYPTSTDEGYEQTSGYITFEDQLGDYMQVSNLSQLVYNGTVYESTGKTTGDKVDTYHFKGTVNSGIAEGNLSDLIITVTRSNDAATGDKVEAKIPASLIPLRHFKVNLSDNTMTVDATTPISVFYSSSLKPQVASLLANPDDAMKQYIESNTDAETGKVSFYANKWSGDKDLGDTTAQFDPASSNSYYYFTQNTPIYTDEDCTTRATAVESGTDYYYQHSYYAVEGTVGSSNVPVLKTDLVKFPGEVAVNFEGAIGTDADDFAIINAGTPRLLYLNQLHKEKAENKTGTANDVLNPQWNSTASVKEATTVTPYLGNNGKLSVEKPATLQVSKEVTVSDGYALSDYTDTNFTFNISVPKAAGKSFEAKVLDAQGKQVGDTFSLTFDDGGVASYALKHGQTLQVFGLSAGWSYTVSEGTLPSGFAQTSPVDDGGNPVAASGTFAAGATATASFTNNYSATGSLDGKTALAGSKVLTGRDWEASDSYVFTLKNANNEEIDKVTVSKADAKASDEVGFNFKDITFTAPGTYTYTITESADSSTIGAGVTASKASYKVVVTVSDNQDGTLKVESAMTQTANDSGAKVETAATSAKFTNSYSVESVSYDAVAGVGAYKTLTGRDWTDSDSFTFKLEGMNGAPMPEKDSVTVTKADLVDGKAAISFGNATYTQPGAYQYQVTEENAGQTIDGVTYSSNVAKFTVNVTDVDAQGAHTGKLAAKATLDSDSSAVFSNVYQAKKATYDTAAAGLTKVLSGRDWKQGDEFTFQITAEDGAPLPQDASGADVHQVTVTKDTAQNFSFGTMTFTYEMLDGATSKAFNYTVSEVKGSAGGISYDGHTATIKVTVTDNGAGNLTAAAEVSAPTFTNTYSASTKEPVKITGTKALTGRDMTAGEFSFGVRLVGTSTDVLTATNKTDGSIDFGGLSYSTDELAKLAEQGKAIKEGNDWIIKYQAYENTEGLADKGITAQASSFEFTVTVRDNLDGTLTATAQMPDGGLAFKNTYNTNAATVSLSGTKVLEHAAGLTPDSIEDKFTFTLSSDDANAPMPEGSQGKTATATNDANGNVSFGDITFTVDDLNKALGTTEAETQADQGDGRAADELDTSGEPAAKVEGTEKSDKDVASGEVDTKASGESASSASGTANEDAAADTGTKASAKATESASGTSVEKAAEPATGSESNEATGKASESESQGDSVLKLGVTKAYAAEAADQANASRSYTFVYHVTESGSVPGVKNDTDKTKTVSIKVTDDGQGHLTAQIVGESGKPAFTFTNHYSVAPLAMSVTQQVEVEKKLAGRDLTDGEFTFELVDKDGNVVAAGTNTAAGAVALSAVEYTKPGEYAYTLREVNGGQTIDHVAYDSAAYSVVVKVVDNGKGALEATCQIGDHEGLVFANVYIEPEPEPTPTPTPTPGVTPSSPTNEQTASSTATDTGTTASSAKTGDNVAGIGAVALIVVVAAGAVALLARRRQR